MMQKQWQRYVLAGLIGLATVGCGRETAEEPPQEPPAATAPKAANPGTAFEDGFESGDTESWDGEQDAVYDADDKPATPPEG